MVTQRAYFFGATGLLAVAIASLAGHAFDQPLLAQDAHVSGHDIGQHCTSLAGLALANTRIERAELQVANAVVPGAKLSLPAAFGGNQPVKAPVDFCRVTGRISAEPGSEIQFEVWMPAGSWNGRYMGTGNGGFAGSISFMDMVNVLKAGFATSSTDTGHQADGGDGSWAKGNPAKQRDYGWRAVHLTAVNAKALIAAFYRKPADKSYFNACSNGGRQGLHEAARFPEDYDGIIAGAPASRFTSLAMSMINASQAQNEPGAALRADQMKLLQSEIVKQCDGEDGTRDGLVDDPRQCKVSTKELQCGNNSSPQCFSTAQTSALDRLFAGKLNSKGKRIAYGYLPSGAEAGNPIPFLGWEGWITGTPSNPAQSKSYPASMLNDFPVKPFGDMMAFNWDRDPARFKAATGKELDAPANMSRFFARGGKLIIWHGWSDAAIPPEVTLEMYDDIVRQSGPRAKDSTRLFMIPGLQHCAGGTGAGSFGQMGAPAPTDKPEDHVGMAMQQWVENGRVPDSLVGRMGFAFMGSPPDNANQRLLCAWPSIALRKPGEDPDKAASYRCFTMRRM